MPLNDNLSVICGLLARPGFLKLVQSAAQEARSPRAPDKGRPMVCTVVCLSPDGYHRYQ